MTTSTAPSHDVEFLVRLGTDLTIDAIHPEEHLEDEFILSVTDSKVAITAWLHAPLVELYEELLARHTSTTDRTEWVELFASKIDEVLEVELSYLIPRNFLIRLMEYVSTTNYPQGGSVT